MRIFVAGATGAIGRPLVAALVAAGHRVAGTSRTEAGVAAVRALGAEGVRLDVFDADAVGRAVAAAAPDVVVHQLTALSGGTPAENGRIRVAGTRNLVDAALAAGVERIVAQSISWVYQPGDTPADEATPLDLGAPEPRATTVAGVRALEEAVAELPQHVVLRYGLLYGPGTWYRRGGLADAVLHGDTSDPAAGFMANLVPNDAVASFVHVDDAARATVEALDWPSGTVNVVDDEPAPGREWVPVLAAAVGAPAPAPVSGRAGWERGATNALARSLGWKPQHAAWRTGFGA
ncbi:NAD-dependent epimerase/dehydratase family protein [Nocardia sp. alder85J]|uniref:NAD-dependent epimerase/dehydratase family protein n=1 Tax=Nocardia sp. alder85J TaxID=2862949 RepID=UPI001CD390C9|nr:NAD(P)-dependent oxidoreductase [Nocardia sp. alder85J]MCX4098656.1 NAD(P)-dependent oxidoreductase [Nocardia sp. alder85J]